MESMGSVCVARRQFDSENRIGSPNLQDFLTINEQDRNFSGPERDRRVRSNRTLLDIIRDDPFHSSNNNNGSRKTTWMHRLISVCLQGSEPNSNSGDDSVLLPGEPITQLNRSSYVVDGSDPVPADSARTGVMTSGGGGGGGELGEQPSRMSLMELLEETDMPMGFVMQVDEGDEQAEKAMEKGGGGGGGEYSCCVCMVRNKGAAFIPCGHTFCRMCCRELWVQRGNCPLCNTLILEILDLF